MFALNGQPSYDVIVVGAGVGGAALALALAHAHPLRVLLVEKHSCPGKINRGDSLLPAVTAHLQRWGVLERFRQAGARPLARMQVFHHRDGLLMEASLASPSGCAPYLVLPHPEIERTLTEAARATGRVEVRYSCPARGLLHEGGRVAGVVLEQGGPVRASLVVGADGASSLVRGELGIPLPRRPYEHSYFGIEVERPAGYEDAMRIELHPAGGILVVPNPSLDRVGLGVLVQRPQEELFRSGSLDERMRAICCRSPLLAQSRPLPRGAHLYRLSRAHAPRYTARGAALIGDAIHVTNPTAGQGMTMAIEDAAALANRVGPALAAGVRGPALDPVLRAYQHERRPRNAGLIRWSHWMSLFYALDGAAGDWVRRRFFGLGSTGLGQRLQRLIWTRVAARNQLQES